MANETPKTVTVEALEYHTYNGEAYQIGDTYEIEAQYAQSVAAQGKAVRVDRVAVAKKAEAAKPKAGKSTAVAPMTTTGKTGRALAPKKSKKG